MITESIVAYGHGTLSPSYMCVHSTANPGATARNHADYWSGSPDYAVHLVSDWAECLHCVPYDALCWQVGNGNGHVEGIELCEAFDHPTFMMGVEVAAQACAERLQAHGWGVDRLITHDMARTMWGGTDHTDPTPYFERFGYSFEQFKARVAEIMAPAQTWTDVVQWSRNHTLGQQWHTVGTGRTVEVGGEEYSTYSLVNAKTGWALDLTNGDASDGTNVGNYPSNGSDAQAWALVPVDEGFAGSANRYTIRSAVNPDYALAVWDGSTAEGANVLLWSANGQPGQVWELSFIGGDLYEVVSANSGMALAAVTG